MTGATEPTYLAFLSYSHKDTQLAGWFHKKLEGWRVDRGLVGRETTVGPVPKTLRPVFRDRDDFAGGHSLTAATQQALEASKFLIVLCSPNSAKSFYVNEEVRVFKTMGRSDRVIPVIIAGEPGDDTLECFPPAVKFVVGQSGRILKKLAEPVAPDAREVGDGKNRALAKVVAGLLGVRFDEIIQRARRAERKRRLQLGLAGATFASLAAVGGYFYWHSANLSVQQEVSRQEIAELKGLVRDLIAGPANASDVNSPAAKKAIEDALVSAQRQANAGDERMSRALSLLRAGKVAEAEKIFETIAQERAARIEAAQSEIDLAKAETAAAYRNLGAIAGLGDPKRAREAYAKALEYEPDDHEALYWHGLLFLRAESLGEARKSLTRLLELSRASDDEFGRYRAHLRLGEIDMAQGNLTEALAHQTEALKIATTRANGRPEDPERQRDLSVSLDMFGAVQLSSGDQKGALKSYGKSLIIIERIALANPNNTRWQRDLAEIYGRLGNLQMIRGDSVGALSSYTESLNIMERLTSADTDNTGLKRILWLSYIHVGEAQLARRKIRLAMGEFFNSLDLSEQLVAQDPNNAGWQRDLSITHSKIGDGQRAQGLFRDALESYQASQKIIQGLIVIDPTNARWKHDLAVGHSKLAFAHLGSGDEVAALTEFQVGREIMVALVNSSPDHADWKHNLAWFDQQIASFNE